MIFRSRSKARDRSAARGGKPQHRGLLSRLLKDTAGNTLVVVGAALVPLTAMIGSGVDLSRAYMARTRLQSACDAASLAARRVMTADTINQAVRDEATRFFNFNFPQGLYETAAFTPTITRPDQGRVRVQAETTIPTVIMRMFGFTSLPLAVDCEASQNFVNTDIVLVLDVTGSMDENLGGSKKIVALRDAVMALYDELRPVQTELELNGMRLRYGVVPYSSTVNVGRLIRAANTGYMRSTAPYQSRRVATASTNRTTCTNTYRGSHSGGICTYFVFEQRTLDASNYMAGNTVNLTPITGGTSPASSAARNSTAWAGCIEERSTVSSITASSGYAIPAGANDLDIDRVPNSDATRWIAHWPDVVHNRNSGSASRTGGNNSYDTSDGSFGTNGIRSRGEAYHACPAEAVRLKAFTRTQMQDYVNTLQPIGGTYHDIGMIWGARLISAGGIFADSPTTFNGMQVAKHVIFMTDGAMAPNTDTYTAYGVENLDGRVGLNDQKARHNQRFKMICNATKGMNVSIWVIAFINNTPEADLTECASGPNQVSVSSNRQQLIDRFTEIGKNIGALRLTQ